MSNYIDAQTVLALLCNGTNGSTSFLDSAFSPKTFTPSGDAAVSTSNVKFNTGSYSSAGSSGFIETPYSTDFNMANSGLFTIHFWMRTTQTTIKGIMDFGKGGGGFTAPLAWTIFINNSTLNKLDFKLATTSVSDFNVTLTSTTSINDGNYHHIAVIKTATQYKLFVDGILEATVTQSLGNNVASPNQPLTVGAYYGNSVRSGFFSGNLDEIIIKKGVNEWTSNFTPPTSSSIFFRDLTESKSTSDVIAVTDSKEYLTENTSITDDITDSTVPALSVLNAQKIISYNPLLIISEDTDIRLSEIDTSDPENPVRITYSYNGVSGASKVTINETNGFIYISCADGKVLKIDKDDLSSYSIIDLSDSDDLNQIDVFPSQSLIYVSTDSSEGEAYIIDERENQIINTNFQILSSFENIIDTRFFTIEAKVINTSFHCSGSISQSIKTDLKILSSAFTEIEPTRRADFHVYINDVELENTDINLKTIIITHTIDDQTVATFDLARRHDDLNHTLEGLTSQITNQNNVKIYIGEVLEFNGKIGQIESIYQKSIEGIKLTAYMLQPTEQYNSVLLPLPGLTERRNLYHVIIQNPKIYNPYVDPSLDIIKYPPKKYLGIRIKLGIQSEEMIQSNSAFDGSTLANKILNGTFKPIQNYTYYWFTGVKKIHIDTDLTSLGNPLVQNNILENTSLYVGTSLSGLNTNFYSLVSCTWHNQRDYTNLELKLGDGTITVNEIYDNITRFPNYLNISATDIFNALITYAYIDGSGNILNKFKRTQLPAENDAVPVLLGTNLAATPFYIGFGTGISNKVYSLLSDKLGYTIGSAPFKEINSTNGVYIAANKYSDEANGLYIRTNDSYNYIDYCKKIAELEYKKLTNISGNILPDTSLGINLTIDAYYYYQLKLLTRINIDNTTEENIFNQANGFPVAIKTISINSNDMQVSLTCDNKKSTVELENIDGEFPDDQDSQYLFLGYAYKVNDKWDLQTGLRTQ